MHTYTHAHIHTCTYTYINTYTRAHVGVVGISEIIMRPGLINVDFADVRTIMSGAGTALMGIGR
jgi:cell division GTPase FtsZ